MVQRKKQAMRIVVTLAIVISIFFTGCDANHVLYGEKEKCSIHVSDKITITYDSNEYVMLKDRVSEDNVGEWVGYVSKNISGAMFSTVYLDKSDEDMINVAVDNCFYKAVKADKLEDNQVAMRLEDGEIFDKEETVLFEEPEINPENATQLVCNGRVYQVTDEVLSRECLDKYIAGISKYIVFDTDTKKVLSQEKYAQIDWHGTKTQGESRTVWVYTDVYEIKDSEEDSIAVKINGEYYSAELLK